MKRLPFILFFVMASFSTRMPGAAQTVTAGNAANATPAPDAKAPAAADSPEAKVIAQQKEISRQRLLQIYDAIQTYRKDHQELPRFLSDLHPKYIADTNVFLCPGMKPEDELPFAELRDPKLPVQYGYEFIDRPIQGIRGNRHNLSMGEWKRMEMMIVGGAVPMLRCFAFDPVLNVSFDGKFYESQLNWEWDYNDRIQPGELDLSRLRLRLLKDLGGDFSPETTAYEDLQDAATSDNRGVIVSNQPLPDSGAKWNREVAETSLAVADQARKFVADFPKSPKAKDAGEIELQMLMRAARAGSTAASERLDSQLAKKLQAAGLSEDDRYELRALQMSSAQARLNGRPAAEQGAEAERDARMLIREFPKHEAAYYGLIYAVSGMEDAKARAVLNEIRAMPAAPAKVKDRAEAILRRMDIIGHPLNIKFTAVDGSEVDLAKLRGKVVLVDFWATWCGPCVAELPHVKAAYDRFHDKGFEVVGISFDSDKSALEKFIKSKALPWPQYFDGKGWENKYGQEYGINGIPAMWLLDSKGNVADTNARDDLAGKVERLLAETKK